MIRTLTSIFVTLALIFGISVYENDRVQKTFIQFESILSALY